MSLIRSIASARCRARLVVSGCLMLMSVFGATAQAAGPSYPNGWLDAPAAGARLTGSSASVSGWALDAGSPDTTGVDRVEMFVDGAFVGAASYGSPRPDMASAFGPRFANSGFSATLDLSRTSGGPHVLDMRAHSTISGATTTYSRNVTVVKPLSFGVNAHLMWYGLDVATNDLNRAQADGLSSVRFDLYWSTIEPNAKGQYDQAYLSKLDAVLALARARGLAPTIEVLGTPGWARGNAGTILTPPTNASDYGDVLAMLAQRYSGVPGLAYEIWNEPNQAQFWNSPGGPNAAAYTRLLKAAYPRVKSAAPSALVLGGSIAFNDQAFLAGMYAAGAGGNFDVLALHPYTIAYPPDSTANAYESYALALDNMHTALVKQGEPTRPIWVTESGWSTNVVSDGTRAGYMQQAVKLLQSDFPYVERFDAYALNQAEDMPDMGLIAPNGVPTASWMAYVSASKTVAAARSS